MKGESTRTAVLLGTAFIILVPAAVVLLALLNLRKTNALTWLVSAVTILSSVLFGFRMFRPSDDPAAAKKGKRQPRRQS